MIRKAVAIRLLVDSGEGQLRADVPVRNMPLYFVVCRIDMGSDADDLAVASLGIDVKDRYPHARSRLPCRCVINGIAVIQAGMRGPARLTWSAGRFALAI